uniref:Uncharacterized protein n=1 Tax=Periophthalmus magnuspinnatus TaxID=409849 RepID=A0A3B4ANK5_9GOBI
MAGAGFCDSRPLLDLHQKVSPSLSPLQSQPGAQLSLQGHSRAHLSLQGASLSLQGHSRAHLSLSPGSLQVPTLLRREVEIALEKLDLIWDHTYAWEMFLDMMKSQGLYTFSTKDLPPNFTDDRRVILVDWMKPYLNRTLNLIKVPTANLQLLGMVCLFIAAKKEESLLPVVSDLCYVMDYNYSKQQLLRMERKVLSRLKFDLSFCSPLHFLLLFSSVARCSAKVTWMARYLLELSLLEGQCVVFQPVQLAEAALCLARLVLNESPTPEGEAAWCLVSSLHVGNESALLSIMHILATGAATAQRDSCATYIKFSSPEAMCISRHPGLVNASLLLGVHK